MATDKTWLSLNVCALFCLSSICFSFSVYSPCLFLGYLIVPFQTIRYLLECTSCCAWECDWAGCSYLEMQKCLFVLCVSICCMRERTFTTSFNLMN